jgi:hypothetical protein
MNTKTRLLDVIQTDNFTLIGIYSSYENYRLAFFLNDLLGWRFERLPMDLDFQFKDAFVQFPIFKSKYYEAEVDIYLINNLVNKKEEKKVSSGLFDQPIERTKVYKLLPELDKLDYLIKIEDEHSSIPLNNITQKINQADFEANATLIPNKQLKSKQHLIID